MYNHTTLGLGEKSFCGYSTTGPRTVSNSFNRFVCQPEHMQISLSFVCFASPSLLSVFPSMFIYLNNILKYDIEMCMRSDYIRLANIYVRIFFLLFKMFYSIAFSWIHLSQTCHMLALNILMAST